MNKNNIEKYYALEEYDVRNDPSVNAFLSRMPDDVANSFTDEQLISIKAAMATRKWGKHAVDIRGRFSLPYTKWHYYYVFVWGRNSRRRMSRKERSVSLYMKALTSLLLFCAVAVIAALVLYLLKSAAGIDLIPNYSFGIWNKFKSLF